MRKFFYLSVCVFSIAVAAWWNFERSNRKSLPERPVGHEVRDRVKIDQPKKRVYDSVVNDAPQQDDRMAEQAEFEVGKGTKQKGEQENYVAGIEKSLPGGDNRVEDYSADIDLGSVAKLTPQAQALRLADDFALPAAMMHTAAIEAGYDGAVALTPQIKAAVDHLVDEFYRDVAQTDELGSNASVKTEQLSQDQSELNINEESNEETRLIAPTEEAMQATEKANQSHQLLFGDDAANRFGVQSMLEVRLPVQGQE